MRSVVIRIRVDDINSDPKETLRDTADRIANQISGILQDAKTPATLGHMTAYADEDDDDGKDFE